MAQLILVSNLDQARTLGMDKNQIIPVSGKIRRKKCLKMAGP